MEVGISCVEDPSRARGKGDATVAAAVPDERDEQYFRRSRYGADRLKAVPSLTCLCVDRPIRNMSELCRRVSDLVHSRWPLGRLSVLGLEDVDFGFRKVR